MRSPPAGPMNRATTNRTNRGLAMDSSLLWTQVFSVVLLLTLCAAPLPAGKDELPPPDKLPAHKELPDPLVMLDGRRITTREQWTKERRPELKKLFQHYMYGYAPPAPAKLAFSVERVDPKALGGKATLKEVTISLAGEAGPK